METIKVSINGRIPGYKEVVEKVFKESQTTARNVKSKLTENIDPIHQQLDKYKPKERKSSALARHYNEVFQEKKPIAHKRVIPTKNNISSDMNSHPNPKDSKFHIKTKPEIHNVQSQKEVLVSEGGKRTYFNKENNNHIYNTNNPKDNYNTNEIRAAGQKSENMITINKRKRIPQNHTSDILMMQPSQIKHNDISLNKNYYQNPKAKHNRVCSETTFDRIFTQNPIPSNLNDFQQYKPQRFASTKSIDNVRGIIHDNSMGVAYKKGVTSKPNNISFRDLSNHAKLNKTEKYYYDIYASHI